MARDRVSVKCSLICKGMIALCLQSGSGSDVTMSATMRNRFTVSCG